MNMRDLIAKLTALEEESKKDKDYDHDSLDKDDVDYIDKNSKSDEDDDEYKPGEEDEDDLKESKKDFDWEKHDKELDATGRYNQRDDEDDMPDEYDDRWTDAKKKEVKEYHDYDTADYSNDDDALSYMSDSVNDIMDDAMSSARNGDIEHAEYLRGKALAAAGKSIHLRRKIQDFDFEDYYQEYGEPDMEESIMKENTVTECGGDMVPTTSQSDNVSMTINMSGSGKGGIHDILDVIRNIEKGNQANGNPIPPVGHDELNKDATMIIGSSDDHEKLSDEFSNSPDVKYASLKHITNPPSNDIHSPNGKVGRAEHPALEVKQKLESLYQFVKNR